MMFVVPSADNCWSASFWWNSKLVFVYMSVCFFFVLFSSYLPFSLWIRETITINTQFKFSIIFGFKDDYHHNLHYFGRLFYMLYGLDCLYSPIHMHKMSRIRTYNIAIRMVFSSTLVWMCVRAWRACGKFFFSLSLLFAQCQTFPCKWLSL